MNGVLSLPLASLRDRYEVIVIGSGYGGAIAASRLSRAGRQVCLLERGDEKRPGSYPDTALEIAKEMQVDGLGLKLGSPTAMFDFRYNHDINVVVGCGLGGTSLINAAIALRPDAAVLADDAWPVELRNMEELAPYFDRAEQMLRPATAPDAYRRRSRRGPRTSETLSKTQAVRDAAPGVGTRPAQVPVLVNFERFEHDRNHVGVTQFPCVGCGDCVSGCNYHAKNTLLMNYLPDARAHGAEIFTRADVRSVRAAPHGWNVHGRRVGSDGAAEAFTVAADIVILAAGTLGSTEILLRSRESGLGLSDQIGHRFSGNGDMIGFAYNTDQVVNGIGLGTHDATRRAPVGPCSTVMLDLRGGVPPQQGMFAVDGAVPGALAGLLSPLLAADAKLLGQGGPRDLRARLRALGRELESVVRGPYHGAVHNTLFLLLMAYDDSGGHMVLQDDRLRVQWPGIGDQPQYQRASEMLARATDALAGAYLPNPVWSDLTDHSMVTGHPLGGCPMAGDPSAGVVNHRGQVFTGDALGGVHEGLYVMDGAVVPTALGVNPLLTISALVERSSDKLVQRLAS